MRFKRGKPLISWLLCLLVIISLFIVWNSLSGKIVANELEYSKSLSQWQNWEENSLSQAQEKVQVFLKDELAGTTERPYKDNLNWTEGSLMALDKAYQASLLAENDLGSELGRILLVKTAQKLELRPIRWSPEVILTIRNNYPDQKLNYLVDYFNPGPDGEGIGTVYDVSFVLDWSGSMNNGFAAGVENPRLHGKNMVESLSRKVMREYPGSRIRMLGYNSLANNQGDFTRERDSSWVSSDDDWETKINQTFYNTGNGFENDDVAAFLKDANNMLEGKDTNNPATGLRPGAVPVVVLLSDYQFNNVGDVMNRFKNEVDRFWTIGNRGEQPGIFLPIQYQVSKNNTQAMPVPFTWIQNQTTSGPRKAAGWDSYYVAKNTSPGTAEQTITDKFKGALVVTYDGTNTIELASDSQLSFVKNSLNSPTATEKIGLGNQNMSITNVLVGNNAIGKTDQGNFRLAYTGGITNQVMVSPLTAFRSGQVNFKNSMVPSQRISELPALFEPTAEAGIELYVYQGSGSIDNVANYQLSQSIVGTNYQSLGGQGDFLASNKLSSLKYGTTLLKGDAVAILKEKLPTEEFNQLDFTNKLLPTAVSKEITFNATQNNYKVYAEKEIKTASLLAHYIDEGNIVLKQPTSQEVVIGEVYNAESANLSTAGWTLKEALGSPVSGKMTSAGAEVFFIYKRGKVTVETQYLTEVNGVQEPIMPEKIEEYEYDQDYVTDNQENLGLELGYILDPGNQGAAPAGKTGFEDQTILVIYTFTKEKFRKLTRVPDVIDFGENDLITVHSQEIFPTETIKVSIIDQLSSGWDLRLRIAEPLKSLVDDSPLKGEFTFVKANQQPVRIDEVGEVVHQKGVKQIEKVELEWPVVAGQGLIFKQGIGNIKGGYTGSFEWDLVNGL